MNWWQYCYLADICATAPDIDLESPQTTEARYRTAISRDYYALFNLALIYLRDVRKDPVLLEIYADYLRRNVDSKSAQPYSIEARKFWKRSESELLAEADSTKNSAHTYVRTELVAKGETDLARHLGTLRVYRNWADYHDRPPIEREELDDYRRVSVKARNILSKLIPPS
jgi:hypothetical protein